MLSPRRAALLFPFLAAVVLFLLAPSTTGGASRSSAILRGLHFIYGTALNPDNFREQGEDYLLCFYTLSASAADPQLKAMSWRMGQERAREWRARNPQLPLNADAIDVANFAFGSLYADLLGVRDDRIKEDIRVAARRFRPEEFIKFDPAKEPPPEDLPRKCAKCKFHNPRGATVCRKCGNRLTMVDPYDLLCEALITSYSGERNGVIMGGRYLDVVQWLPRFRPYHWERKEGRVRFESIAYTLTHLIYTLNDYSLYRLRPEWLPEEYQWLRDHFRDNIREKDAETLGEFIDTLKSFGVTEADPLLKEGLDYLLAHQNADGSWGNPHSEDAYVRYHTTWTAIGGLMDYAWRGEKVAFPEALRLLRP